MLPTFMDKYNLNNTLSYFENNLDYAEAINKLNELQKRGIAGDLCSTSYHAIVNSKDPKIIDKYEILYNYGYLPTNDSVIREILKDENNFSPEQIKQKLDELFNLIIKESPGVENVDKKFLGKLYCVTNSNKLYNLVWMIKDNARIDNCGMPQVSFIDVDAKYKFYTENRNKLDAHTLWQLTNMVNKINSNYIRGLYLDESIPNDHRLYSHICSTNESNINIRRKMYDFLKTQKDFPIEYKLNIISSIEEGMAGASQELIDKKTTLAEKLCADKELDFPKEYIASILNRTNDKNITLAEKLSTDKELNFPKEYIGDIIRATDDNNITLAEKLCTEKELDFPKRYIQHLLRVDCHELILKRLDNPRFVKDITDMYKTDVNSVSSLFVQAYDFAGKNVLAELTKTEKRELIELLLANKKNIPDRKWYVNEMQKEKAPILPTNTEEYALIMKKLANSMNISLEPVSTKQTAQFNKVIDGLSHYFKEADLSNLEEINLTMTHTEFISKVESVLKHLPKEEQARKY